MKKVTMCLISLCLLFVVNGAQSTPVLTGVSFNEIGNDVKATFGFLDGANFDALLDEKTIDITIQLLEDDILFDDFLGQTTIWIMFDDIIGAGFNGWATSQPIMHTFTNAADAFTGFGDDYILEITNVAFTPEPPMYLLFAIGLAGVFGMRIKTLKKEKPLINQAS